MSKKHKGTPLVNANQHSVPKNQPLKGSVLPSVLSHKINEETEIVSTSDTRAGRDNVFQPLAESQMLPLVEHINGVASKF
jgi:hypothetical protein